MSIPSDKPLLSILVPAYRYAEGVQRILFNLHLQAVEDCEVIIFDDSEDDEVELTVVRWYAILGGRLRYQHNRPALGAVANWNALLDAARGEYCLLLHHDEFPLGVHFLNDLSAALRRDSDADVLMLDCVLVGKGGTHNRRHLPMWFRTSIANHFPQYLFRRNVIGPTSALVIRRSLCPRFDVRLQWLVDVDLYVRLLKVAKHLESCSEIKIGSILHRTGSITANLAPAIRQVHQKERMYLCQVHTAAALWLGPVLGEAVVNQWLRGAEAVCWTCMRALIRIIAVILPNPVSRPVVERALANKFGSE